MPGKYIIFREEKKDNPFCVPSGAMGTSSARDLLLFLVKTASSYLKCLSVKEVGHPRGCLCFMPVAPACRIFVMHFKVGIIVPFVKITKLTVVLLREYGGKSDRLNPVNPEQKKRLFG